MNNLERQKNIPLAEVISNKRNNLSKNRSRRRNFNRNFSTASRRINKNTVPSFQTSSQIFVSDLESHVSSQDLREIFKIAGKIKDSRIHFDKRGKSLGTAEVTFFARADAIRACKKYNKAHVDGRPMKIEMLSGVDALGANTVPAQNGLARSVVRRRGSRYTRGLRWRRGFAGRRNPLLRRANDKFRGMNGKSSFFGAGSFGVPRGLDEEAQKKFAESLDAELDSFKNN
ncbi:hypothetical protein MHBO_000868 [Bonamia ostreae]|uniref:RRM domain-containing protein n=1 Tax=Bonamia ostreae TaxID=126728 RepID=A0ABV2AH47_9EUKA